MRARLYLIACAAAAASTDSTDAQTVYAYDGATAIVGERAGPPAGICAYPDGREIHNFSASGFPFGCPIADTALPPLGGMAVNKATDTVWVTDGFVITEYPPRDAPLRSFGVPAGFALTGMGWDSAAGILWVTDGVVVAGIVPPPPPGCGMLPVLASPPFLLPSLPAPPATGITWDSVSGSLFVCDAGGFVTNVMPGGAPGPFAVASVVGAGCSLTPPITGITMDSAASATGVPVYYASDSSGNVGAFFALGGLANPSFHTPAPCFDVFLPVSVSGIAFSAHGLAYGAGADTTGLSAPEIFSTGQSLSPSPDFRILVFGSVAHPASTAFAFATTGGAACPTPTIAGLPVYLSVPPLLSLGSAGISPGGGVGLPAPIPPGVPAGVEVDVQVLVITPTSLQVTGGLHFTVALP